jgi:hypothetical protein
MEGKTHERKQSSGKRKVENGKLSTPDIPLSTQEKERGYS